MGFVIGIVIVVLVLWMMIVIAAISHAKRSEAADDEGMRRPIARQK